MSMVVRFHSGLPVDHSVQVSLILHTPRLGKGIVDIGHHT